MSGELYYGGYEIGVKTKCPNCKQFFRRKAHWAYGNCCTYGCMRALRNKVPKFEDGRKHKESEAWKRSLPEAKAYMDKCLKNMVEYRIKGEKEEPGSPQRKTYWERSRIWRLNSERAMRWIAEQETEGERA